MRKPGRGALFDDERRYELLLFIRNFRILMGRSPTLNEVADRFDVSTGTSNYQIRKTAEMGLLELEEGDFKSTTVTREGRRWIARYEGERRALFARVKDLVIERGDIAVIAVGVDERIRIARGTIMEHQAFPEDIEHSMLSRWEGEMPEVVSGLRGALHGQSTRADLILAGLACSAKFIVDEFAGGIWAVAIITCEPPVRGSLD